MRIVDLSFSIRPHFRWKVASQLVAAHATGHPLQSTVLTISYQYLTNLDQIGAPRCRFVALPLKLEGADGCPVRAIAMVE